MQRVKAQRELMLMVPVMPHCPARHEDCLAGLKHAGILYIHIQHTISAGNYLLLVSISISIKIRYKAEEAKISIRQAIILTS